MGRLGPSPRGLRDAVPESRATLDCMATTVTALDGIQLVVQTSGTGAPVVFVHGSNGGLDSWAEIGEQLAGHQIVRYARRNHAPSGPGPSPNTFTTEASDLHAILDAITDDAGESAHVVGGSYGSTVALHAALGDTERIASLALFEPPLLLSGAHLLPVLARYRSLCAAALFADALELFARDVARIPAEVLAAVPPAADDPALTRPATIAAGGDLEAMAHDTAEIQRWSRIDVPVLLMQGGQTWSPLPEGMDLLASAIPHAQRVVWPDQSHFATVTVPSRVAETIQQFLVTV
jgi:pimeloyl-ACP methyl ester carboxylesterase